MLRRFILVGVFVVIQPGSIEQLSFATFITLLYLAIQLAASPFKRLADDFLAATCSLALSMLFLLSLIYKFGALTQLDDVQEVMSLELQADYVVSYVWLSGILWATCMSTFAALGVIATKLVTDEALERARGRRLVYIMNDQEVPTPKEFMANKKRLDEMIRGPLLYRKDVLGNVVKSAILPAAGPFHVFLSHSARLALERPRSCLNTPLTPRAVDWKHGQGKMRIVKKALQERLPGVSVFLECVQPFTLF